MAELLGSTGAPESTAKSWLTILEERGWVQQFDGIQGEATLTARAHDELNAYFDGLLEELPRFFPDRDQVNG